MSASSTKSPQKRRLDRMAEQGVRQSNVLVHDDNRQSLDALRPHLIDPASAESLAQLVTTLSTSRPVNISQVRHISPFRYPGGKTWLVPVAREWLKSLDRPDHLLEPFAGGGVIGLTAAAEGLVGHLTMVELDSEVAAVWQVLIHGSDRDAARLQKKILDFDVTLESVRSVLDGTRRGTVDQAFRTIVKNRCQRSGIMAPGAGLVKSGENGRGLTSRWYADTLAKRIEAIRGFRHKVTFEHGDALEAIQQHTGAAMFVDPPYTAGSGKRAGQRLYTHNELDHEELFRLVAEHAGPAMLTYDDDPDVRAMAAAHGFTVGDVAMKSTHHVVMRELAILKG